MLKASVFITFSCAFSALCFNALSVSAAQEQPSAAGEAAPAQLIDIKLVQKTEASLQQASSVVEYYGPRRDTGLLQKAEPVIETAWQDFLTYQGKTHPLVSDLSLIRARSITAVQDKTRTVPAWKEVMQNLPATTETARRISLSLEAAEAAASVKDFKVAEQYFAAARVMAVMRSGNADMAQLYMRLHELGTTGEGMAWRPLRDSLLDLRKYAENFALWSVPRLDALLGEAEIRVKWQPEEKDKRKDLSELKAQIVLAEKGMDGAIPAQQLVRLRTLYYTLEDRWKL